MYLQVKETTLLQKQNVIKSEKSSSLLNSFSTCAQSAPLRPSLRLGLGGGACTGHLSGAGGADRQTGEQEPHCISEDTRP